MLSASLEKNDKKAFWLIGIFSVIVFSAVVLLSRFKLQVDLGFNVHLFALANAIIEAKEKIAYCSVCFSLTDRDPCDICRSDKRDHGLICVVEDARDVAAMERTRGHERNRGFQGGYHVLQGVLSPLDGIGPENLILRVEGIPIVSTRQYLTRVLGDYEIFSRMLARPKA